MKETEEHLEIAINQARGAHEAYYDQAFSQRKLAIAVEHIAQAMLLELKEKEKRA